MVLVAEMAQAGPLPSGFLWRGWDRDTGVGYRCEALSAPGPPSSHLENGADGVGDRREP